MEYSPSGDFRVNIKGPKRIMGSVGAINQLTWYFIQENLINVDSSDVSCVDLEIIMENW